jgi:hypothetical protein
MLHRAYTQRFFEKKFWWENLKETDHLENLDMDGRILKMDLKETG